MRRSKRKRRAKERRRRRSLELALCLHELTGAVRMDAHRQEVLLSRDTWHASLRRLKKAGAIGWVLSGARAGNTWLSVGVLVDRHCQPLCTPRAMFPLILTAGTDLRAGCLVKQVRQDGRAVMIAA